MDPELKILIELQETDQALSQLASQISASPGEIQALRDQLNEFAHAAEERKTRLAANQKERRGLDGEVQEIRTKIERHKDQLYQVKTNEQYRAMMKEIGHEEENIAKIEDRILEKMIESEQIDKQVREISARLENERKRVEEEVCQLESNRQAAETEQRQLSSRRAALVAALSEQTYALYDKLLKARNGMALAEARDGFCGGCHVRLRPQAYNDVRTSDHLVTCEACSRILYYTPPVAGANSGLQPGQHATV